MPILKNNIVQHVTWRMIMSLNEVAPPGFGHTKGDEKKGVKKGGTAAAFDRARKRGDF